MTASRCSISTRADASRCARLGAGRRRLAHPAEPAAAGYAAGRSRLAQRAPRRHADQMLRDEAEAAHGELAMPRSYIYSTRITPADMFGQFAKRTRERGWLALFRDRRQPCAERHRAGSADGGAGEDRRDEAKMARGPARYAEPLISVRRLKRFERYQPACKPGSVGHRPLARTIRDGHSSGTMFAHGLEQPTRTASLTSPCGVIAFANSPRCRPYSVLLPVGFAMPSPLPDPRCALTAPFHPCLPSRRRGGRFVLCGTFPGVAPAGRYPAPYVDGARTFLSRGLSAIAGAAVRPTDALGMGA